MEPGSAERARLPMIELRHKTMLIIGLGGIGSQVAQRAAAFGMRVLGVDPKDIPLSRDVEESGGSGPDAPRSCPKADVVVSSVPHTPASEGMLGAAEFAAMKDESLRGERLPWKGDPDRSAAGGPAIGQGPRRRPGRHRSGTAACRPPPLEDWTTSSSRPTWRPAPTGRVSGWRI